MKKILSLVFGLLTVVSLSAQTTQRVLQVHRNGSVVFQAPTALMDSIKSVNGEATFHYGDGSWSCPLNMLDSITFGMEATSDTVIVSDTMAISPDNHIVINYVGDSVQVTNPYANDGVTVALNGQKVTVTAAASIANLIYELRGQSSNGNFVLNTDKKFILLLNGVNLAINGKPAVNVKDSKAGIVHLMKGTQNSFLDSETNDGKACFYSKGQLTVQGGGELTVNSVSVNGFQGKEGVVFNGGNVNITVSAATAKGIKTDGNVVMNGGNVNIIASGSLAIDTLADGTFDKSYSSGVKPDGDFVMNGGNLTIDLPASNRGGKCISTSGNTIINGGYLDMTTAGDGACLGGTGTSATDGYVNSCIKSDSNIYITGGHISAISSGKGGRGICAEGHMFVGEIGAPDNRIHLYVQTSGATTNPVSGGWGGPGGWGGSNTGDADYFKGIAKGIRCEGNIYINSGNVQAYCAQQNGDPTGEAIESKDSIFINGGNVEANAYDDAINAAVYLEINGGNVWAYSRGNDGIDCNGNTNINGGLILVKGSEVGFDAATDAGGHFAIHGGTILTQGGNMGAWDTPNAASSQRWISISSANSGNNGLLILNNAGDTLFVYKNSSFTGNGFLDLGTKAGNATDFGTGTKPPPGGGGSNQGIVFSCPQIQQGNSYTVYKSATITGGTNWHGVYTNASAQGVGTASTITAQ